MNYVCVGGGGGEGGRGLGERASGFFLGGGASGWEALEGVSLDIGRVFSVGRAANYRARSCKGREGGLWNGRSIALCVHLDICE